MHGFGNQGTEVRMSRPTEGTLYSFPLSLGLSGFGVLISQERNASTEKQNHRSIKLELTVYAENYFYCCCDKSSRI